MTTILIVREAIYCMAIYVACRCQWMCVMHPHTQIVGLYGSFQFTVENKQYIGVKIVIIEEKFVLYVAFFCQLTGCSINFITSRTSERHFTLYMDIIFFSSSSSWLSLSQSSSSSFHFFSPVTNVISLHGLSVRTTLMFVCLVVCSFVCLRDSKLWRAINGCSKAFV